MGTLTSEQPKPTLEVGGRALIEHQVMRLVSAGVSNLVVNLGNNGEQIATLLGDGAHYGAAITYSDEGAEPLETGGGILNVLGHFGGKPFVVMNADVCCDFDLRRLPAQPRGVAHLVLVPNPEHNPDGDFALQATQQAAAHVHLMGHDRYTYAGISVLRAELFAQCEPGRFPLGPLLRDAVSRELVTGELYQGTWIDVGTPERLEAAKRFFAAEQH